MSTAYYIVFDHPDSDFDSFVNGKCLAHNIPTLNRICQELGVKTFDEYVSQDPEEARAMIEACGGDPDAVEIPEERWFPGQEGLDFAQQVYAYLESHPQTIKNPEGVLSELQEYIHVFEQALPMGMNWHLQVDF
jgi:hypothetical protein